MEAFLLYILKSGICLAVFYVCFKALFSNDTFFRFNRWILLAGTGVCMLLPFCRITTTQPLPLSQPVSQLETVFLKEEVNTTSIQENGTTATVTPTDNAAIPWIKLIGIAYLTGCCVCLSTTVLSFRKMYQLMRKGKKQKDGKYTLVLIADPISPFSWGRYIFLSGDDYRNHPEEILTHEKMHLRYNHSADLLYMEMIILLQWCNPAVWLLKRELRDIHEYQADKGVLNQGIDATKYQLLLVKKAVGSSLYTLANSFNHSKIKKRITMMLKKKSNNWARLKLALLVPAGLAALSAFARTETVVTPVQTPAPAVIEQVNEELLPTASKSTNLQKDIQDDYNVYLSFTKNNNEGKEVIDGISIYGVGEQKALGIAEKAIKNGRFVAATKVIICPHTPKVPMSYLEKMKDLFDRNNIKCNITKAQGYDDNGNALPTPPPPPPAPDAYVTLNYKSGKKEEGIIVYKRFLETGEKINERLDKIYSDDISTVTITTYKWTPDGVLEGVEKFLKDRIKLDGVKYVIQKK